jgi:hypothetical protein
VQALEPIRVRARAPRAHRERGGAETQGVALGALGGVQVRDGHVLVEPKEHLERSALETPDRARRLRWRIRGKLGGRRNARVVPRTRQHARRERTELPLEGRPALRGGRSRRRARHDAHGRVAPRHIPQII